MVMDYWDPASVWKYQAEYLADLWRSGQLPNIPEFNNAFGMALEALRLRSMFETRITEARETVEELLRVLDVAVDRALEVGDRLVGAGHPDINRGQFLSLVRSAEKRGRVFVEAKSDATG